MLSTVLANQLLPLRTHQKVRAVRPFVPKHACCNGGALPVALQSTRVHYGVLTTISLETTPRQANIEGADSCVGI
jgi:hypothetical protein